MLKIILFAVLFFYAIYRVSGFLVKIFGMGSQPQQQRNHPRGNVRVDDDTKKSKKSFEGGEYIDYEEVN